MIKINVCFILGLILNWTVEYSSCASIHVNRYMKRKPQRTIVDALNNMNRRPRPLQHRLGQPPMRQRQWRFQHRFQHKAALRGAPPRPELGIPQNKRGQMKYPRQRVRNTRPRGYNKFIMHKKQIGSAAEINSNSNNHSQSVLDEESQQIVTESDSKLIKVSQQHEKILNPLRNLPKSIEKEEADKTTKIPCGPVRIQDVSCEETTCNEIDGDGSCLPGAHKAVAATRQIDPLLFDLIARNKKVTVYYPVPTNIQIPTGDEDSDYETMTSSTSAPRPFRTTTQSTIVEPYNKCPANAHCLRVGFNTR